jgi:anti-anti-sigma regulatory factor
MYLTVEHVQNTVPVTILGLHGDLDASNFEDVIAKARELYRAGTRYLLLDLSDVPFMGSSGLVALHSIALLMRGEEPPDPEYGWQAFHDLERDRDSGIQQHVKLLNPQPRIDQTLEVTGMKDFFAIYTDRRLAIASF